MAYIQQELKKETPYATTLQSFNISGWSLLSTPTFSQTAPTFMNFTFIQEFYVFELSPSVTITNVLATPVPNLGCSASDYASFPRGTIAIVSRGNCSFVEKEVLAAAAGAVAVIIYNDKDRAIIFGGYLEANASIPSMHLSSSLTFHLVDLFLYSVFDFLLDGHVLDFAARHPPQPVPQVPLQIIGSSCNIYYMIYLY